MNPLDKVGQPVQVEFMNPVPSSRGTADGPKYFVKFECDRDFHDALMSANFKGMQLVGALAVSVLNGKPKSPTSSYLSNWAAARCGEADFREYLSHRFHCGEIQTKDDAIAVIKAELGLDSLSKLDSDGDARNLFNERVMNEWRRLNPWD